MKGNDLWYKFQSHRVGIGDFNTIEHLQEQNKKLVAFQSHRVGEDDFNPISTILALAIFLFQSHRVGVDDFNCHILHFVNSLYNTNGNLWQSA